MVREHLQNNLPEGRLPPPANPAEVSKKSPWNLLKTPRETDLKSRGTVPHMSDNPFISVIRAVTVLLIAALPISLILTLTGVHFRPEASRDELTVFALVPLLVLYATGRLLAFLALASTRDARTHTPREAPFVLAASFLAALLLAGIMALSAALYFILGLQWASEITLAALVWVVYVLAAISVLTCMRRLGSDWLIRLGRLYTAGLNH
jgi:hypothetical protein